MNMSVFAGLGILPYSFQSQAIAERVEFTLMQMQERTARDIRHYASKAIHAGFADSETCGFGVIAGQVPASHGPIAWDCRSNERWEVIAVGLPQRCSGRTRGLQSKNTGGE